MKERGSEEELVRAARVYAGEQVGWLAPALYGASLVMTGRCPSLAAIDRHGRVYFNPDQVSRLREALGGDRKRLVAQLGFVWVHEITHWLREHDQRAEEIGAQAEGWNLACDLEINDEVPPGLELPRLEGEWKSLLPKDFGLPAGQIAEWYYRRLREQGSPREGKEAGREGKEAGSAGTAPDREQGEDAEEQGSPREGKEAGREGKEAGSAGTAPDREQGEDAEEQGSPPPSSDEGSGVHGQPRSWELPREETGAPALSDFDRQALREEVARRIQEHQKSRGDLPAGWVRWAEEVFKPQINWREQLKRVVRGALSEGFGQRLDYSLRRPNRRAAVYQPFILPALQGEYRPRVTCVIDTSGSITERELGQSLAEVKQVLEQLRVPVTVIPCDAVPYEAVQVLTRSDWLKAGQELKGGGGTDMREGLQAALELKPPPDVVLILTDGYTPYPDRPPPKTVVVWGIWVSQSEEQPPLPPIPPWRMRDVVKIPIAQN